MNTEIRYDRSRIEKFERMDNGMIRLWGTIATVGWLQYVNDQGDIREEYASEEALFDEDFLQGIGGAPLTLGHPPEMVTPANYKKYAVGSTGTKIIANKKKGCVDIVTIIGDQEAIRAVVDGKKTELSMGYLAAVVPYAGDGNKFKQISRKCNHNAIVAQARAKGAKLHLDGIDHAWHCNNVIATPRPRKAIKLSAIKI